MLEGNPNAAPPEFLRAQIEFKDAETHDASGGGAIV
jgi:hypothetical protein